MSGTNNNVVDDVNAIIGGSRNVDAPLEKADALSVSLSYWKSQGAEESELEQARDICLTFIGNEKSASAARSIKAIARTFPETQDQAIDMLSALLDDTTVSQDTKRTATIELGSLAQMASESLTTYDVHIDKSPLVASIRRMFRVLEKGQSPQIARAVGPIVMATKSPSVTYEGLKLILNSKDAESAKTLDQILDHKQDYDTQKITALADAISFVDDMSSEMRRSIQDYFIASLPTEIEKFQKSVKKIKGLGKLSSAFSDAGSFDGDQAHDLLRAESAMQRALHDLNLHLTALMPPQTEENSPN